MVLLFADSRRKRDQCDHIVANLIAQTPGLQLDKRMPAEGADIVYLKHPQTIAISIFCPVPPAPSLTLSADWLQDPAPPAYFQLIGKARRHPDWCVCQCDKLGCHRMRKTGIGCQGRGGIRRSPTVSGSSARPLSTQAAGLLCCLHPLLTRSRQDRVPAWHRSPAAVRCT